MRKDTSAVACSESKMGNIDSTRDVKQKNVGV